MEMQSYVLFILVRWPVLTSHAMMAVCADGQCVCLRVAKVLLIGGIRIVAIFDP